MRNLVYIALVLLVSSCLQPTALFDVKPAVNDSDAMGHLAATEIYSDYLSSEIWFSKETGLIDVQRNDEIFSEGESSLEVTWNKLGDPGAWLGVGFGWDNWSGKDFGGIVKSSAIHFKVKPKEGRLDHLPIAIALEDHSGAQAWTGFSKKMMSTGKDGWKVIHIPLESFNWAEQKADYTNIKQLIIQFEASGDLYLDDVKVVPFDGLPKKNVVVPTLYEGDDFILFQPQLNLESHMIGLYIHDESLVISGEVIDPTPMQNSKSGSDVWNGDCIEIAFSRDPNADLNRKEYTEFDYQLGIRISENPMVWSWKEDKEWATNELVVEPTDNGYSFKLYIERNKLGIDAFQSGKSYGFEIAIDEGTENGRTKQVTWNSDDDGFSRNPSLWGVMNIE